VPDVWKTEDRPRKKNWQGKRKKRPRSLAKKKEKLTGLTSSDDRGPPRFTVSKGQFHLIANLQRCAETQNGGETRLAQKLA